MSVLLLTRFGTAACLPNLVKLEWKIFNDILSSYLSDRKQIVVVDGQKSDILDVKAGVPQGSRLGPLLFLIYMNDITDEIESDILNFADDTSLFATGSDPAETAQILNRDLQKKSN